jgi:hypothetical protein
VIIVYACVLLLALHLVLPGSRLRRLAAVQLRHTELVWLALLDQVLIISVLGDAGWASRAAHLASYALAGLFVVANRRLTGVPVVAAGGALNLLTIVANGGTMPASESALRAAGTVTSEGRFANSAAVSDPRLPWLGDVFATPSWLPVQSVFSVGDVVIVVGIAVFLHRACRQAPAPAPTPATASG